MAMARSAMLFAPPLPPLTLPHTGTVVLGRGQGAHLRLGDPDTSRRHAEITCQPGQCVLRDLGSTNGTWVNGKRVELHTLRPGDRIEIGSHEIAFCEVETQGVGPSAPGEEAQTRFAERSTTSESFRGDLAEIPPFAVLQILEMGRKTGVLVLDSDGSSGKLWLRRGDPIHAQTKSQVGFDAALALVHARSGRFTFEPEVAPDTTTIEATVTELLLEASRRLDEGLLEETL
jgi:pSer/pThr/pTyr-binding forkhead associated (FHA) protein